MLIPVFIINILVDFLHININKTYDGVKNSAHKKIKLIQINYIKIWKSKRAGNCSKTIKKRKTRREKIAVGGCGGNRNLSLLILILYSDSHKLLF